MVGVDVKGVNSVVVDIKVFNEGDVKMLYFDEEDHDKAKVSIFIDNDKGEAQHSKHELGDDCGDVDHDDYGQEAQCGANKYIIIVLAFESFAAEVEQLTIFRHLLCCKMCCGHMTRTLEQQWAQIGDEAQGGSIIVAGIQGSSIESKLMFLTASARELMSYGRKWQP